MKLLYSFVAQNTGLAHFFPAEFMRRVVAERLDIVPDEIAAGHCVALSRPKELAHLLEHYAAHAGRLLRR